MTDVDTGITKGRVVVDKHGAYLMQMLVTGIVYGLIEVSGGTNGNGGDA